MEKFWRTDKWWADEGYLGKRREYKAISGRTMVRRRRQGLEGKDRDLVEKTTARKKIQGLGREDKGQEENQGLRGKDKLGRGDKG